MLLDVQRTVEQAYRDNPPATLALYGQDASPTALLNIAFNRMAARWLRRFDEFAPKLADWFATDIRDRLDATLAADLRRAGFTVRLRLSSAMRDALGGIVSENVSLLRSLPAEHIQGVRVAVMQSVQAGRDLATLTDTLVKRNGITRRRAANIALDQNNKASSALARTRYLELGITRARWMHSAGGTVPRPTHVAFSGKSYDVKTGVVLDPKEGEVWPGSAINCRCFSQPLIAGLDYCRFRQ